MEIFSASVILILILSVILCDIELSFASNFHRHNYHGTQKKNEKWNKKTVRGCPIKISIVKIDCTKKTSGIRFIIYFFNGSWFHFDIYTSKLT